MHGDDSMTIKIDFMRLSPEAAEEVRQAIKRDFEDFKENCSLSLEKRDWDVAHNYYVYLLNRLDDIGAMFAPVENPGLKGGIVT